MCFLLACTSPGPSPAVMAELAEARAQARAGCYRCLEQAVDTYDRITAASRLPAEVAREAFTTSVLLVARARELGIADAAALQRAMQWAARVPPSSGRLPPAAYLEALALITGDISGLPNEAREDRQRAVRKARPSAAVPVPARAALDPALATDETAQYLALAFDCEQMRGRDQLVLREVLGRHDTAPIRYRLALCGVGVEQLPALRQQDARWAETFYAQGRVELGKFPAPDIGAAAALLASARDAFPESLAITLALANARNSLSDHESALALFDEVLAVHETHREALLGRVMSLSYLNRYFDAIRTATRMVDLGTYLVGDAYYWRAWNRYHVHLLPAAWEDVEQAAKFLVNTSVYALAGFIAYAQKELATAVDRLQRAFKMDATNCEAVWTEGLVHVDQQAWREAAARFPVAATCFGHAADAARQELAVIAAADWAPAVKARRAAAAQKRLDTARHRRAQAAFNAASSHVRLGQRTEALAHLQTAAAHPLLKEKADALRMTIEKQR